MDSFLFITYLMSITVWLSKWPSGFTPPTQKNAKHENRYHQITDLVISWFSPIQNSGISDQTDIQLPGLLTVVTRVAQVNIQAVKATVSPAWQVNITTITCYCHVKNVREPCHEQMHSLDKRKKSK